MRMNAEIAQSCGIFILKLATHQTHRITQRLVWHGAIGFMPSTQKGCCVMIFARTITIHFVCSDCDGLMDIKIALHEMRKQIARN